MFIYDNEFEKKELLLGIGTTYAEDKVSESLEEINALVSILGIRLLQDTTAGGETIIKLQLDTKKIENSKKRGAGRPRGYHSSTFSYGDIYAWRREGKTTKEIIEILGCSRATYYRRLKEALEWNISAETKWLG